MEKKISKEIKVVTQDTSGIIGKKLSGNSDNDKFDCKEKVHVEKPFSGSNKVNFAKFLAMVANFNDKNKQL